MTNNSDVYLKKVSAIVCGLVGVALFQIYGNANQGYIDTRSLFWWWSYQWINPASETEHGWLIFGLSIWLFWRNLKKLPIRAGDERSGLAIGVALMSFAIGIHTIGYVAQQARVSIVALLLFVGGILSLVGGRRWARAAVFPLGFMFFAIPLNVLDSLGFYLRLWVSESSTAIAHLCGVDVIRNGTQLVAPDGSYQYEVAAACSGVRSMVALMAISLLEAYITLRSWSRRVAAFLLCIPFTYLGNIVRITAVIFTGQWLGQKAGLWVHDNLGFLVYVIVMAGVLLGVGAIRRWWPETPKVPDSPDAMAAYFAARGSEQQNSRAVSAAGIAIVLIAAAGSALFLRYWSERPFEGVAGVVLAADGVDPVALPDFVAPAWRGETAAVTEIERETLPADTGFSRLNYVSTRNRAAQVYISLVLSGRDRTSIHRPELCLLGQGWSIVARSSHVFSHPEGGEVPATVLHIERELLTPKGERVVLHALYCYWFVGRDEVVATHLERIWHTILNTFRGRADRWAYVTAQTPVLPGKDGVGFEWIQSVLDGVLPVFQPIKTSQP